MQKERIREYTLKVSQANATELIVITYDIILDDIAAAKKAYEEGDTEALRKELKHAQRFVSELISALDFSYALSVNLLRLYEYVQKLLVGCEIGGRIQGLETAEEVITGLRSAFAQISSKDNDGAVMRNTQQVYAGLTYGKGVLNEAAIDPDSARRGFLA